MYTVAIISRKGGAGKSTLAQNLAVEAKNEGRSVLLVDLDSQPTSSDWGDRREEERADDGTNDVAVLSAQPARLKAVLAAAERQGYDLAILDTPPRADDAAVSAAKAASLVLTPVRPLINDLATLGPLRTILDLAESPETYVVISQAPSRGCRHLEARRYAESAGFSVSPVTVYTRSAYGDAPASGLSAAELEPKGKAAREMQQLFQFLVERENDQTKEPRRTPRSRNRRSPAASRTRRAAAREAGAEVAIA